MRTLALCKTLTFLAIDLHYSWHEPHRLLEEFVKKVQSLSSLAALAIALGMISWGSALHAQSTPSTATDQPTPQTSPDTQTPQTAPTPSPEMPQSQQVPSAQTPDQAPSSDATTPPSSTTSATPGASAIPSDSQIFAGTVTKQGDKYVLKDDSGQTYDVDHQDELKKFDGKRVKVQGTLDSTGKKIMVK